jgi:hypothetical protein
LDCQRVRHYPTILISFCVEAGCTDGATPFAAGLIARQDLAPGGNVALELVCHDHPRNVSQALQQLAKEPPDALPRLIPLLFERVASRTR